MGYFMGSNDYIYEGMWKDGQKNGKGKVTWRPGEVYEGNFENGKRNGYGEKKYIDGSKYKGEWKNNKKNGLGTFIDENGNVY